MRYPFDKYRLGTGYGAKGSLWRAGWHSGQDFISVSFGGDGLVYPLYAGRVLRVSRSGSYGNCVQVRHADGYITLYAHLRTVYVRAGQKVGEDTVLGIEGATGNATGRHLHLEVHKGEYHYPSKINPLQFIARGLMNGGQAENIDDEKTDNKETDNDKEAAEIEKELKINLNGREKKVQAIEKRSYNYVRLQDLRDELIAVEYDEAAHIPVVRVHNK